MTGHDGDPPGGGVMRDPLGEVVVRDRRHDAVVRDRRADAVVRDRHGDAVVRRFPAAAEPAAAPANPPAATPEPGTAPAGVASEPGGAAAKPATATPEPATAPAGAASEPVPVPAPPAPAAPSPPAPDHPPEPAAAPAPVRAGHRSGVVVRTVGLARHYRRGSVDVAALDGVDIEIRQGEQVAVMGPSGSGKSTLLSLLGALDRPTAGRLEILGRDLAALGERERSRFRRRNLGFIFQDYDLLGYLTAVENVAVGASLAGHEQGVDPADLLSQLGLTEGEGRKRPDQLSGGQQQRVGIARCLAARPGLILADEPTGSLDSVTSATVVGVLIAQARAIGSAVIVVTHDPAVARRFDRIVWLRDGKVATSPAGIGRESADG